MANTRSAEKQNRQAQKHRVRNAHVLSTLRTSVRKFREAAAAGDAGKTKQGLAEAVGPFTAHFGLVTVMATTSEMLIATCPPTPRAPPGVLNA